MIWVLNLLGVSEKIAKWLAPLIWVVLIGIALIWLRKDAFNDGMAESDQRWKAAIAEANEASDQSADEAEESADEREKTEIERVTTEKERIDEAIEKGEDPFDALFPTAG